MASPLTFGRNQSRDHVHADYLQHDDKQPHERPIGVRPHAETRHHAWMAMSSANPAHIKVGG
jgi:hypothetical protein